jgi:subtilisin family serine protease
MDPLSQTKLHSLMSISRGIHGIVIGIIDGPIDFTHHALKNSHIRTVRQSHLTACKAADSMACIHGTFIAGILCADRRSAAPAICPDCKIILRPIFSEGSLNGRSSTVLPSTTPQELSTAIIETVDAGARVINLSLGLSTSVLTVFNELEEACEYASRHGVILVSASGNQGRIGYLPLFHNRWVIPVAACDNNSRLSPESNFGASIGSRGLMAPGVNIASTFPDGKYDLMTGSSVAAPFVSGAIALLWSIFPNASSTEIKYSIMKGVLSGRRSIIPPLLNAEAAKRLLKSKQILF